jgi:ketosteroid isomerase-like protein
VKWLVAAFCMMAAMPVAADNQAEIRDARARYNAAIAGHDSATIRTMFIDDYKGLAGSGGELIAGGDAMAAYFANAFRNPDFLGFVRTPDVITVAIPPDRAMERGHWQGGTRNATLRGEYLAVWVPTAAGWKLRSESFVTLGRQVPPPPK